MVSFPLDDDAAALFVRMRNLLQMARPMVELLNDYYEGDHRVEQLGLAIPPELRRFSVFLGWPRVTVDGCEERLDVTGFRLPGRPADAGLWEVWQYNDLDEYQTWAHVDALALARSYICVGTNPDDAEHPLVTVESPREMITLRDPANRAVTSALRLYSDAPATGMQVQTDTYATLYLPNSTHYLMLDGGNWTDIEDPDVHNLGRPPVVTMANRNRSTLRRNVSLEGVSEMTDVIPLAESASRALTNAQLAQETHAVPHRALLGVSKGDFFDTNGNALPVFEAYFGAITALTNPNAKAVQFDATDMTNFETMINVYARAASGVAQMPLEYFGLNTENAPSAEGQRAGETRLIRKSERKQVSFGHAWESAMRLALRFRDGVWDPDARGLETMWRDAGTPTLSQVSAAVTQQFQVGLTDWETAQEDLGRTPAQIAQMKQRRTADMDLTVGAATAAMQGQSADPGPVVAGVS